MPPKQDTLALIRRHEAVINDNMSLLQQWSRVSPPPRATRCLRARVRIDATSRTNVRNTKNDASSTAAGSYQRSPSDTLEQITQSIEETRDRLQALDPSGQTPDAFTYTLDTIKGNCRDAAVAAAVTLKDVLKT